MSGVVLEVDADDLADHGVLAHEHGGGAAEGETDLGHLVRPDIVGLGDGGGGGGREGGNDGNGIEIERIKVTSAEQCIEGDGAAARKRDRTKT